MPDLSLDLGSLLAGLIAAVAAIFGLLQWRKAEAWKRAEFAGGLLRQMETDSELSFCCRALDWGVGPLLIPEKYRPLFPKDTVRIDHSWEIMARALRPNLDFDWSDPQHLVYRYSFDTFLSYLDRLQWFVALKLVERSDLDPIDDYLKHLESATYYGGTSKELPGVTKEMVFGEFIGAFYPRVRKLLR